MKHNYLYMIIHSRNRCDNDLSYTVQPLASERVERYLKYSEPITVHLTKAKTLIKPNTNYGIEIISMSPNVTVEYGGASISSNRLLLGLTMYSLAYYVLTGTGTNSGTVTYRNISCDDWLLRLILTFNPYIDSGLAYSGGSVWVWTDDNPPSDQIMACSIGVKPSGINTKYLLFTIRSKQIDQIIDEIDTNWIYNYDPDHKDTVISTYPPCKNYYIKTEFRQAFLDFMSNYDAHVTDGYHPSVYTADDKEKASRLSYEATSKLYRLYCHVMHDTPTGLFDTDIPYSDIS